MQLIVGYFHYPEQVGFLTGWVHHLCVTLSCDGLERTLIRKISLGSRVYIVITVYLQFTSWTCLFMLACLMEVSNEPP
jgi:hypothetical protein